MIYIVHAHKHMHTGVYTTT